MKDGPFFPQGPFLLRAGILAGGVQFGGHSLFTLATLVETSNARVFARSSQTVTSAAEKAESLEGSRRVRARRCGLTAISTFRTRSGPSRLFDAILEKISIEEEIDAVLDISRSYGETSEVSGFDGQPVFLLPQDEQDAHVFPSMALCCLRVLFCSGFCGNLQRAMQILPLSPKPTKTNSKPP